MTRDDGPSTDERRTLERPLPRGGPGLRIAAPAVVALLLAMLAVLSWRRHGTDLTVYWRAAVRALEGEPLYPASDGLRTYRYAPGAALLLAFLAPLRLPVARAVWYALMVGSAVQVVRRQLATNGRGCGAVVLIGFLGVLRPFVDEFHYAQANVLVLFLLTSAFALEDRGRDAASGVLVALAAGLKLAPLVFLGDFLLRRRWRAALGAGAGLLVLALLPLLTYGVRGAVEIHREWVASLGTSALGLVSTGGNQSLFGAAARASLPRGVAWVAALLVIGSALRARAPEPRRSLLLVATVLAAPLGWNWNYVLAFPAAVLLASRSRRGRWAVAALGVLSLVPMYDVAGAAAEHWVFEHSMPALAFLALFVATAALPACDAMPGCAAASGPDGALRTRST